MNLSSNEMSWDFREEEERRVSTIFREKGYIIQGANMPFINQMTNEVQNGLRNYFDANNVITNEHERVCLEQVHNFVDANDSNNLRLHIMKHVSQGVRFNKAYYQAAEKVIDLLCGNELAMQKRIGISINFPNNESDALPIHADTWNGVSPYELNIWIPMVNCRDSMSLYIIERGVYNELLCRKPGLLKRSSDEIFKELKSDLTWIDIDHGEILAFDQSLPHGYSINREVHTHWSFNCRFKSLHTPYWDKKLGEYFMPITVKECTRIGMSYKHPKKWIE